MEETAFALLVARLDRMEDKIDKLMSFRSYLMGVAAVCGLIGAKLYSLIRGY